MPNCHRNKVHVNYTQKAPTEGPKVWLVPYLKEHPVKTPASLVQKEILTFIIEAAHNHHMTVSLLNTP
jgi:hypothetical protein